MIRSTEQNRAIHGLLNELNLMTQKANIIAGATNNRTSSSKDLTEQEAQDIIKSLNLQKQQRDEPELKKMRGKITFLLVQLGYVHNQKLDTKRADIYIRNIGSNNPRQVSVFELNKPELQAIIAQLTARLNAQNASPTN
jgi:hypothetical protein